MADNCSRGGGLVVGYGKELILDMSGCNVAKFNRRQIKSYFAQICKLVVVEPEDFYFWDDFRVPEAKRQTNPKTKGTTAIQFILTSNIIIHTLDLLGYVFVNIFLCKEFDIKIAEDFTVRFFEAEKYKSTVIKRGFF